MADEINTAEIEASNATVKAAVENYVKLVESITAANAKLELLKRQFGENSQEARAQVTIVTKLTENLKIYEQGMSAVTLSMGKYAVAAAQSTKENMNLKQAFDALGASGHPAQTAIEGFGAAILNSGKMIGGAGSLVVALGNDISRALIDPLSSTDQVVSNLPSTFKHWNDVMANHQKLVDSVNMSYLSYGRSLEEAQRPGRLLQDDIGRISAQFGIGKDQAFEFIKGLKGVPGAFDAIGKSVATTDGPIAQFGQLMMVAKATGMDSQKVAELMTTSFERFGQKGVGSAVENIAIFHAAIAGTDIPMNKAMSQIRSASEPLAIFGRKMTETTGVWKTFTNALHDVPIDAVGQLFQTVSKSVAEMSLNTQAFVAQMSGMAQGASALGGALRMELAMREPGGMERNLERVMQTISRLGGGRIINLQEAAQNPALEMQFQMQRQLAGQMLGVQGNQQQSRVLEVLQGVEKGGIATIDASKEVQSLMQTGQKAQDMSNTLLQRIVQNTGRIPEFAQAMIEIEKRPKAEMGSAGRAVGAAAAGDIPRVADMRMMGQSFARAGQQFVSSVEPSMTRLFNTLAERTTSILKGVGSFRAEQNYLASRRAGGPIINVTNMRQTMTAEPLPTAGVPSPFFRSRERQTQRQGMSVPIFYQPEMEIPPAVGDVNTAIQGRNRVTNPRRAAEVRGENETYVATPIEPAEITVNVICKECMKKEIHRAIGKGLRDAMGERGHEH